MTERVVASRPNLEQMVAIIEFMEQHPVLGLSQMRGMEGRNESKKLWLKLTSIVNNMKGPTRPMKSWVKFWADKKSTVRAKVVTSGGDPSILGSSIERRIWDKFLHNDSGYKPRGSVKVESHYIPENNYSNEESTEENNELDDEVLNFDEPTIEPAAEPISLEERNMVLMEKLVKVMSEQATAMSQLAHASQVSSQAMERLAEASQIQSRAIERLANTFEAIGSTAHHIGTTIVDIDTTMKRFYNTTPT
ncbi:uncharacterized protein LOC123720179 [Pieris brassicae]|uniref:Regulatory protein zeste n=1 Tax=Pieris brassicae TaxID=7116 RepID=A0A9P0XJV9_PIEBR|nr:uncharacterized protein LOC123720179 [Pieris brassicae]CAH4037711.1 unnamed protein product [Pieris brassicae]